MNRIIVCLVSVLCLSAFMFIGNGSTMMQPGAATQEATSQVDVQIRSDIAIPSATESVKIIGDFYQVATVGEKAPTVLLIHGNGGNRTAWDNFIPVLVENEFNVLAVDTRGFGQTGGRLDWELAEDDIAFIFLWLREQSSVDGEKIAIIGASAGANLAIRGGANDEQCAAIVALSPNVNYYGMTTEDAVSKMKNQALLLMGSAGDTGISVRTLAKIAPDNFAVRQYKGGAHAIGLFGHPDAIPTVINWLNSQLKSDES